MDKKAIIDAVDQDGRTPLFCLVDRYDEELPAKITRLLLAKGANVNAKMNNGHNLLQAIILESNMWFEIKNSNLLASKIARELARLELVKILVEEGHFDLSMLAYVETTGEVISLSEYAFLHGGEGIALYLEEKIRKLECQSKDKQVVKVDSSEARDDLVAKMESMEKRLQKLETYIKNNHLVEQEPKNTAKTTFYTYRTRK